MTERSENMVALVTGANKGMGREISRQLGKQGMTVLIGARDEARGEQAAKELHDEGIDARFLHIDVTDDETVQAARDRIESEFGRLDVLVNNAGIAIGPQQPSEYGAEVVRQTYETNVIGVVAVTHAMLPLLRHSSTARVVNMSSPIGSLTLMSGPGEPARRRRTARLQLLEGRPERHHADVRQRVAGYRHTRQRRQPRIRGDRPQRPSWGTQRRGGCEDSSQAGDAAR